MTASAVHLALAATAVGDYTYYDGASYETDGIITIDFADQSVVIPMIPIGYSSTTAYGFSQGNVMKRMKNWNGYIVPPLSSVSAASVFFHKDPGGNAATFSTGQVIGPGAELTRGMGSGRNTRTYVQIGSEVQSFSNADNFQVGPFSPDGVSRYLGLSLDMLDGSGTRYGWMKMTWAFEGDWNAVLRIDGYAFSDVAGESMVAGQIPAPGALPLLGLAFGAAGIRRARK